MAESSPIISQNLKKTYRDGWFRKRNVEALKGITLEVPKGEIFGLLGPNGAGKTTFIKILLGIVKKTSGEARLMGAKTGEIKGRRNVGYLPEGHRLPAHLTGYSALDYYGGLSGLRRSQIVERQDRLLKLVGLEKWGKHRVRKYSKGMLQRLGLAQALIHDPDLLILDEPTDGVDPVGRAEIREILKDLKKQGKTIFLNSHLLQEIELVCDRVAVFHKGQIVRSGRVGELAEESGEVSIEIRAPRERVEAALQSDQEYQYAHSTDGEGTILKFQPRHLQHLNQTIDRLRQDAILIVSVTKGRKTLEDVFLKLIQEEVSL